MYIDLIKKLLKKYYGEPRASLNIGEGNDSGGKSGGKSKGKRYYYSFEQEKEIAAIRQLLAMKGVENCPEKIPELSQTIPGKGEEGQQSTQCVCFEEHDGQWIAAFHNITGVSYRGTEGGGVEATLKLGNYPFIVLSDSPDDFYGFWRKVRTRKPAPYQNRAGLSYWVNKTLKTDERFRDLAVDFFVAVAEAENKYILKDVARTISKCGFFLPPVSYEDLLKFRTPSELIRSFQAEATVQNVDFNKIDVNTGYIMVALAPEIDRRDLKVLAKFKPQMIAEVVSLNMLYDGFSEAEFVRQYYRKTHSAHGGDNELRMYAEDYVRMCVEAGEVLRIGYSCEALIRAHDELMIRSREKYNEEELQRPLVRVPSRFDDLEKAIRETGSPGFERIMTTRRLFQEGERQHNCVFSRRGFVRDDRASIYHWDHKGLSYTVQFSASRSGRFFVEEIRARFNKTISSEHRRDLERLIGDFCDDNGRQPEYLIDEDREIDRNEEARGQGQGFWEFGPAELQEIDDLPF